MSEATVNTECADNCKDVVTSSAHSNPVFFTEEEPDSDYFGRRRHWFGRPSMRGYRLNPSTGGGYRNQDAALST